MRKTLWWQDPNLARIWINWWFACCQHVLMCYRWMRRLKLWTEQSILRIFMCFVIDNQICPDTSDTSSQHPPPPPCYQVSAHSQTLCYENKNTAWSSNLRTLNSDFASQQMHRQLISIGGGEKKLWNGIFIRLNLLFEIFLTLKYKHPSSVNCVS